MKNSAITRRNALSRAAGLGALLLAPSLRAQAPAFPNKQMRILVPFAPGGSLDPVARMIGEHLQQTWGQPVVVDNRPGGNTTIASLAAARSPADGHTLLLTASTHVINQLLMKNLPYDSEKDFMPVCTVIRSEFVLVAHPSVPANTLQELIALVKAQPGKINYASSGMGNANHLAAELFNQVAGTRMHHVPYKGGGQAVQDLLGGQVQVQFSVPFTVVPHIRAGRLKAFAYTGPTPPVGLTDVPSFAQAGLPAFDIRSWQGVMVPGGTPRPVIDKLAAEIGKLWQDPQTQEKLRQTGQEPWYQGTEQFAAMMKADAQKYADIIRVANIRLD
jgi:tripartite-type tricarboxylate transporter receptor subunit TctC